MRRKLNFQTYGLDEFKEVIYEKCIEESGFLSGRAKEKDMKVCRRVVLKSVIEKLQLEYEKLL